MTWLGRMREGDSAVSNSAPGLSRASATVPIPRMVVRLYLFDKSLIKYHVMFLINYKTINELLKTEIPCKSSGKIPYLNNAKALFRTNICIIVGMVLFVFIMDYGSKLIALSRPLNFCSQVAILKASLRGLIIIRQTHLENDRNPIGERIAQ